MEIGTLTGALTIEDLATMVLDRFEKKLDEVASSVDTSMEHVSTSMRAAATVGSFLGNTFANLATQALSWGKNVIENSLMAGARLEQLGAVTTFLGERAGYSKQYVDDLAMSIEKSGITGVQSRDAIVQLLGAHIDLSHAAELSAIAQNMATIAGESSSVTYGKIIRGITSLQPELLRTSGFTVSLNTVMNEYKETTGKSANALTGQQKQQLLLNAVLKEGAEKAGLYGLSMEFASKQAGSAERAWEQVSEQIGTVLLPVTSVAIKAWYSLGSSVRDAVKGMQSAVAGSMEGIAESLQTVITVSGKLVGTVIKVAVDLYKAYQLLPQLFRDIATTALLAAAGIWAINAASTALMATQVWKWAASLTAELGFLFNMVTAFGWEGFAVIIGEWGTAIATFLGPVGLALVGATALYEALKYFNLLDPLIASFKSLGAIAGDYLGGAFQRLQSILASVADSGFGKLAIAIGKLVLDTLIANVTGLWDRIVSLGDALVAFGTGVSDVAARIVRWALSFSVVNEVADILGKGLSVLGGWVKLLWEWVDKLAGKLAWVIDVLNGLANGPDLPNVAKGFNNVAESMAKNEKNGQTFGNTIDAIISKDLAKWSKNAADASAEHAKQTKELEAKAAALASSLPTVSTQLDILTRKAYENAASGTLTKEAMASMAQSVIASGAAFSDLDPILQSIVTTYNNVIAAGKHVADSTQSVADQVNAIAHEAFTPLSAEIQGYIRTLIKAGQTQDQVAKILKDESASAVKLYYEEVKKGTNAVDSHNKKIQELLATFQGAGKKTVEFEAAFAKLTSTQITNLEVQRRVAPEIDKITDAGGTLTTGMQAMTASYQANLVANQARIKILGDQQGITQGLVDQLKQLGRSEADIAHQYNMTSAELTQYLALQDREMGNAARLATFAHAAAEQRAADDTRKRDLFLQGNAAIAKSEEDLNDLLMQNTMTTTEYQLAEIQKRLAKEIASNDLIYAANKDQRDRLNSLAETKARHDTDLINSTTNTLIERLHKQSVFTKSELATQASAFKTTYDQMVASGNYTSEQLVAAWHRYADAAKAAGVGVGVSWRAVVEDLKGVLVTFPDLLVKAFTGGGNLLGAIKAFGVQLLNVFLKDVFSPLQSAISGFIDSIVKKFSGSATSSLLKGLTGGTASKLGTQVAGTIIPGMIGGAATSTATSVGVAGASGAAGTLGGAGFGLGGGAGAGAGSTASMVAFLTNPITIGVAAALVGGFLLYKKFHQPEWAKLGSDIGRDLGVAIPKEMLKAWEADAKNFGRQATTLLHLDEIIKQAGGITSANFTLMAGRLRDTFVLLGQNILTAAQATEILDKNFNEFVTAGTSKVGVLNKSVVELIRLQDEFGTKSKAIAEYQAGQAARAGSGLTAALSVPFKALQSYDELNQKQMDIRAKMAQAKSSKELEKLQAELKAVQAEIIKQGPLWDITKIHSQAAASAIAASLVGIIAQNMAAGMSFVEAAKAMGPAVESLQTQLELTGFTGGSAFGFIKDVVALTTNEIAGPALESIHGYAEALVGMSNIGLMNQDVFAGITSQIQMTEAALEAQGFSGKAIHAAMQADIQKIWELQQQYGYTVDASTQALIDQSVAEGLVGEQHKSTTQQMLDASNRMVDVLEAMATFMGVTLPRAAETGANGVQNALDSITAPDLSADVNYHVNYPDTPRGLNEASPMSMGGIVKPIYASLGTTVTPWMPRGTDVVPAMLTPGEQVRSVAQVQADKQKQSAPQEVNHYTVEFNINALDAQSVKDAVVKPGGIGDIFITDVENKKRGRDMRLSNALPRGA